MAQIKIELSAPPVDGMDIKFQAPCDCSAVTGMVLHYPAEDGNTETMELTFRDAHGNNLAGIGNLFSQGAYVKVIVDVKNGFAYLQNADNNAYLNSAILGTYIHNGGNLTGSGGNGKFKATASGTISSINVNGVACSVKCGEESSMDLIAGCWYTFILDGNTVNFNSGGASGGLNLAVVGNPQPASPKENTIWVDTDARITGYIFSATEPETPAEGVVWIQIGTHSPAAFNALKKNGLMIYPMSAKQYIGGAWVYKTAKSYQGGQWVEWIPENALYYNGDECAHVSGGWQARGWKNASNYDEIVPVIVNRGDHMEITVPSGNVVSGAVEIKKDQDFTNISGITIDFEAEIYDYFPLLMVISRNAAYLDAAVRSVNIVGDRVNSGVFTRRTVTLDTTGLTGVYDVAIGFTDAWAGTLPESSRMKVYSVMMERGG